MKQSFTVGQIALYCGVAHRTVQKWIDNGHLKGYRLAHSEHRRVAREELMAFVAKRNIHFHVPEEGYRVLLLGCEKFLAEQLRRQLSLDFIVYTTETPFVAGYLLGTKLPQALLIDLAIGRQTALQLAREIRLYPLHDNCHVLGLVNEDEQDPAEVQRQGFSKLWPKPLPSGDIIEWLVADLQQRRAAEKWDKTGCGQGVQI